MGRLKGKEVKFVDIKLQIPEDLLVYITSKGISREKLDKEFRKGLSLLLFKRGTLSIGKASQLAGLSIAEFEEFLIESGEAVSEYTEEDYEREKDLLKGL